MRWTDGGGRATVSYEVHGLPDKTRWKVGAYGYSIGYTPQFVDPFLGSGGLQLDGSSFIDVELSTVGVSRISKAGRSTGVDRVGTGPWGRMLSKRPPGRPPPPAAATGRPSPTPSR